MCSTSLVKKVHFQPLLHCGLVLGFSLLLGYTLRAVLNTKGHSVGSDLFVGSLSPLVVLKTKDFCQSGHGLGYVRTPYYQCYWPKVEATCQIRKPKGWSEEGGRGQQTIPGLIGTNACK